MVLSDSFFVSLERYIRKMVARSPLPYTWMTIGLVVLAIVVSLFGNSMVSARSLHEAIQMAAQHGDYPLAQKLLGDSEDPALRDIAYPEEKVLARITQLEEKLELYPENRQIYLALAELYGQLQDARAAEYREKARILDPNGVEFR